MNCKKCGISLTENDQFCKNCGASVNAQSIETLGNSVSNNIGLSKPDLMISPNMESSKPDLMISPNMESSKPDLMVSPNMESSKPDLMANQNMNTEMNSNMNTSTNNDMNSSMNYNSMNGNNMNNSQPSWNNGYYSQPNNYNNNKSNNNNTKYIVLGVVVVVALFAVIFVISMVFGKDSGSSSLGTGSNSGQELITQTSNSTYKVNFKGFTLSIPDNLVYEEQDGILVIGNEVGTWVAVLELEQGSFAQLKANKSQLQSLMQQSGYTASIASEKTLKGVDFITLEISSKGQKSIAALAKANSMYFFCVTAYNQNNEYDYSLLEKVAPILSSAQYNNATNNIQVSTKIDMNGIADLAK